MDNHHTSITPAQTGGSEGASAASWLGRVGGGQRGKAAWGGPGVQVRSVQCRIEVSRSVMMLRTLRNTVSTMAKAMAASLAANTMMNTVKI